MKSTSIQAADLFAGAGGFSTGLLHACADLNKTADLLAVNHWPRAIETHSLNHPGVRHLCENLDNVDPRKVHPGGKLGILLASPECVHFSNARGGVPMSDQSRASAWHIVRWADALRIDNIIVENVREFQTWGPLNAKGRPIPHKKGEVFRAWCNALEALGYHVDFDVLNSADYGAATARRRLFIVASKRRKPRWPEKTHSAEPELFTDKRHRAAREIIDWSLEGSSIFGRKKPLADKTLARIAAGLKKFGGVDFVLDIGGPNRNGEPRDLARPLGTLLTRSHHALCQPFLVIFRNNRDAASLDAPLSTITTTGKHHALCEAFIVQFHDDSDRAEKRVYSVEEPLRTLDTSNRYALAEPFIAVFNGQSSAAPCDVPLPTVTTVDRFGLCQPEPIAVFERDGVTYGLMDIRFRMLQPHECAAAMGFEDYEFTGTKKDKMKMIGNAVSVECARALCRAVLQ